MKWLLPIDSGPSRDINCENFWSSIRKLLLFCHGLANIDDNRDPRLSSFAFLAKVDSKYYPGTVVVSPS